MVLFLKKALDRDKTGSRVRHERHSERAMTKVTLAEGHVLAVQWRVEDSYVRMTHTKCFDRCKGKYEEGISRCKILVLLVCIPSFIIKKYPLDPFNQYYLPLLQLYLDIKIYLNTSTLAIGNNGRREYISKERCIFFKNPKFTGCFQQKDRIESKECNVVI
jgi:hypothetical protein